MNLGRMLLYGGAEKEDYKRIEKDIWKVNRKNLIIFCFIMTLILAGLCFVAYNSDKYTEKYFCFYALDLAGMAIMFLALVFLPPKKPVITACLDLIFATVFGATIYMSCVLDNDRVSVSFMVFLIFLPQIISGRPISMIIRIFIVVSCFIGFNTIYCSGKVLYTNRANAILFGILIIVFSTVNMSGNIQRYLNEYKLRYIGDIDFLTGVNNRNSYERKLSRYEQICKDELNCIYIDVNGLHNLNNTKGHDAGDLVIQGVAEELKQNFRQSDIYRIGGDEFVVFVADTDYSVVKERIESCQKNLLEQEFFISYGIRNMKKEDIDISIIVNDAETFMFEAKDKFYKERGLTHR